MNKSKQDTITYGILILLGLLFYLLPGEWISIQDDSIAYLSMRGKEGVLPGYPIFLLCFKKIFTEQYFLHAVVIVQSLLAVVCTFLFVLVLKKQFHLHRFECIFLYILCMLPFSIYLPEAGITHMILTEGITYSAFYLFFIAVLKTVWSLEGKWYLASMAVAFLLGLIRSQLLFLQVICFFLLIWIVAKKIKKRTLHKFIGCIAALFIGIILAYGSYKLIYKIVKVDIQYSSTQKHIDSEKQEGNLRSESSQFSTLIIARGFYEADETDVDLFDDNMMREIFQRAYQLADQDHHRYEYASDGLYMWQDLVYDKMNIYVSQAIEEYDQQYPDTRNRSANSIMNELGLKVLIKHFDRYIYHTIRLMMPSFIATVFFQIESIYLLCHLVALFLYLGAIIASIVTFKTSKNMKAVAFMVTILITMVSMVFIMNVIFIGLQRYVVYGMGIFYCAFYVLLRELVLSLRSLFMPSLNPT